MICTDVILDRVFILQLQLKLPQYDQAEYNQIGQSWKADEAVQLFAEKITETFEM
jgi:hypothetical protein